MNRLVRLCWTGKDAGVGSMLAAGCMTWALYSLVQILVNGVVLDESIVPAQILTNAVQYPPGHPHDVFYRSAYALSHFMSAGMWAIVPDALIISGFRNWLFMLTSTFAPFAVTLVVTRRPMWAHVATALVLLGISVSYAGVYPIWAFPHYYSNGNIGLHMAVISVTLLAAAQWRTGALLAGMMPAIHATLTLAVWPWAGAFLLLAPSARDATARRTILKWFAAGLAVSVGLGLLVWALPDPAAAAAPFLSSVEGSFRRGFLNVTDVHRQSLPWFSTAYLIHPFAFGTIAYLLTRRTAQDGWDRRQAVLGLVASGLAAWAIVYGAWAVYLMVGTLPGPVETAMPWRFSTVSAVLLSALAVGVVGLVAQSDQSRAAPLQMGSAALLLAGSAAYLAGHHLVNRSLVEVHFMALLLGLASGAELSAAPRDRGRWIGVAIIGAAMAIFWSRTHMAAYYVGATALTWAGVLVMSKLRTGVIHPLMGLAVVAAMTVSLSDRTMDPVDDRYVRWERQSVADVDLANWLSRNASPHEMVLTPFYPRAELQAKTSQPVLLEHETLWIMTYMPALEALIGTMVMDLYGVDYREPGAAVARCGGERVSAYCEVWSEAWTSRTAERWSELGAKYGFRLVLTPADHPLQLPEVWSGGRWRLHEISPPSPSLSP